VTRERGEKEKKLKDRYICLGLWMKEKYSTYIKWEKKTTEKDLSDTIMSARTGHST
jgi:hypothetical protein